MYKSVSKEVVLMVQCCESIKAIKLFTKENNCDLLDGVPIVKQLMAEQKSKPNHIRSYEYGEAKRELQAMGLIECPAQKEKHHV